MNKGCGKAMKVYFDSEYEEKGFAIETCQKGFLCVECSKLNDANHVENANCDEGGKR